jgi:SMC interacting uncharacterized protein involved in chromosome segregation
MVDSEKIKNHKEHLTKLIVQAETDSADSIKDLVDYLMLYKGSAYSDLILRKAIALVTRHPDFITADSKSNP